MFYPSLGALAILATATYGYVWPSPQLDALESARWDQEGFNTNPTLTSAFQPCDSFFGGGNTGRSNVADWIRTAYHDMATHNSTDGTGGLDASIRFGVEQARPENVGDGFNNTMEFVTQSVVPNYLPYLSMSDSIALLAVLAIENCGGPEIAFRGGRIDAGVPGAPGVPQPQDDLNSHIASFARQGFTQTEMIGLVACGHTFGGVQHSFFPDIVNALNDPTNIGSIAHFDTTFVTFDNNVATEYISGTTQNPLVVGFNDTTNSDKRIFGSDGNTTMQSFANSPATFASTCADLFAHMLDTVPTGVQLTDVISPLPVKPSSLALSLNGNILQLTGQVRLWNVTDPSPNITMLLEDHTGSTGNFTLKFVGTSSSTGGKYSAAWYTFNDTDRLDFNNLYLDAAAGVKSLSFMIDGKLEDQNGLGFPIQDGFLFSKTSCLVAPLSGRIDVAVRNGVNPTRVFLQEFTTDSVQRIVVTEVDISPSLRSSGCEFGVLAMEHHNERYCYHYGRTVWDWRRNRRSEVCGTQSSSLRYITSVSDIVLLYQNGVSFII
ncbi:Peroxidase [Mycena sanguinolenta]|uniref:Peroxidase n=1 Tax=Mycena sanguinolenta TaxID=230812 RepID=A0A8H6Y4U8_9AGAR|nr:Peroxidase [Mycena sanguinolenta]